jgi:hypothetical protein
VKTFREFGGPTNGAAELRTKGNLRGKRRDPWLGANAPSNAVAVPEPSGQDALALPGFRDIFHLIS